MKKRMLSAEERDVTIRTLTHWTITQHHNKSYVHHHFPGLSRSFLFPAIISQKGIIFGQGVFDESFWP
jgi:hypothetical protein